MPTVRIVIVEPQHPDARGLLVAYIDELARVGVGRQGMRTEWNAAQYGAPRGRIVLAYSDGAPVGCAGLREHARDAGELKHLYVVPVARRSGIGAALVGTVEDQARDAGFRRVVLDTAAPLEAAARLYARAGYAPTPPFNDNPHATSWFEKKLPLDDRALWGAFVHSSLPAAEWTHDAHLRVAFLHLARFADLDEAHLRMRAGILRLNAAHGLVETAERGYHETLTRAWLAIVAGERTRCGADESIAFVHESAAALEKSAPLRFYSRELLLSVRARATFVEPDLAPLPT